MLLLTDYDVYFIQIKTCQQREFRLFGDETVNVQCTITLLTIQACIW
jgi:hypothetical protein